MSADDPTNEPSIRYSAADRTPVQEYEIRIRGCLGSRWATWFDGMTLIADDDGTSVIRGSVVDQAALHGLLQQLRDLGITLISLALLTPLAPSTAADYPTSPHHTSNQTHHSPGATS